MGAVGPSFREHVTDGAPAGNAGETIASALHLKIPSQGRLGGGVRPTPDGAGHVTVVTRQLVGETRYFDAAGYPGRTLGPAEARH